MKIQIQTGTGPLEVCDRIITPSDHVLSITPENLRQVIEARPAIDTAAPSENFAMKTAVLISRAVAASQTDGPVEVVCDSREILSGVCSLEYLDRDGSPVRCVPLDAAAEPARSGSPDDSLLKDLAGADSEIPLEPDSPAPPSSRDEISRISMQIIDMLKNDCHLESGVIPSVIAALKNSAGPEDLERRITEQFLMDGIDTGLSRQTYLQLQPRCSDIRSLIGRIPA